MSLSFGTDGVRGDTRTTLTGAAVHLLARAGAEVLGPHGFAVGRDPRESGAALTGAILDAVAATGGLGVDLGVVPTPTVARWCADHGTAGAMVSASHNPWHDNGVKFFAAGGRKLDDATQARVERRLAELFEATGGQPEWPPGASAPNGEPPGASPRPESCGAQAERSHLEAVAAGIGGRNLAGLRVVVDCANGAASRIGPECLRRLGAEVSAIHAHPDGRNINAGCGSLHLGDLQAAVIAGGADAGIAFDGDADRMLAVDHTGAAIDGDQVLAICAIDRHSRGRLTGNAVVVTVMANLGLLQAMASHGIETVRTPVGDRHVLDALETRGLTLGGEQSGHLIFRDLATTGDGLLTAVQLLDVAKRSGEPLAHLAEQAMVKLPQVLVGVPLDGPAPPEVVDEAISAQSAAAGDRLGDTGRVLVRKSGTEPLVRVMVEAPDEPTARAEANRVAAAITEALRTPERS